MLKTHHHAHTGGSTHSEGGGSSCSSCSSCSTCDSHTCSTCTSESTSSGDDDHYEFLSNYEAIVNAQGAPMQCLHCGKFESISHEPLTYRSFCSDLCTTEFNAKAEFKLGKKETIEEKAARKRKGAEREAARIASGKGKKKGFSKLRGKMASKAKVVGRRLKGSTVKASHNGKGITYKGGQTTIKTGHGKQKYRVGNPIKKAPLKVAAVKTAPVKPIVQKEEVADVADSNEQ